MVSVGALLSLFYNVVVSWAIWYLVTSISTYPLAWATCGHEFSSENCFSKYQQDLCNATNSSYTSKTPYFYNNACISLAEVCTTAKLNLTEDAEACTNGTDVIQPGIALNRSESVEEFWSRNVLGDAERYTWDNFVSQDTLEA